MVKRILLPSALTLAPLMQTGMFNEAEAYERFMGRWSRKLAAPLVAFSQLRTGDAVLDVGSGTGALSATIAANDPAARITGIDPAPEYIAFAEARHRGALIRFEVGDAQQ